MQQFHYRDNQLYCENLAVQEIAGTVETPFYLYSRKTLLEKYAEIESAFAGLDYQICVALKANSNPSLLALLADRGAGADVVSAGEIYIALKSGIDPRKIVYAGVGKRDDEITYALEKEILALNVESVQEIAVIDELAGLAQKKAPIALRINPNIDVQGHPYVATGRDDDKFGIGVSEVRKLLKEMQQFPNVSMIGLHCHIGSQITEVAPFLNSVKILRSLTDEARRNFDIKFVDIGGGLGVPYENVLQQESFEDSPSQSLTPRALIQGIGPQLKDLGCRIIFEPGRSLMASCGILVTRVLFTKQSSGKIFIITDAGMTDLIRPSLYDAYHEIVPVMKSSARQIEVDVVGPICESGDFLAKDRLMREGERGDLLAVLTAGAYGYTLSSNYNARPRPAEVLVDDGVFALIRERGGLEDLWP